MSRNCVIKDILSKTGEKLNINETDTALFEKSFTPTPLFILILNRFVHKKCLFPEH